MPHGLQAHVPAAIGPASDRSLIDGVISMLPAFRRLSQAHRDMLADHSQLQEARRGAVIVQRGERVPGVIGLASGSAKLSLRHAKGDEKVLRLIGPGESFGLAAALLDRPSPVEVVALSHSLVATIPPVPVLRLMEQDAGFARFVARALAERVLELVSELEASVQQSGLQRLACFLNSLAKPEGQPGSRIVRLPATKTTVAARLGVQKETLSRMLRELAARGLVEVSGPEIAILDRAGLVRLLGVSN